MSESESSETTQVRTCVDLHLGEVHLESEAIERGHVEGQVDVAQVLADHLLGQSLPRDEEARDGGRAVLEEAALDEVRDALLRLLVEDVESGAVVPLAQHLVHRVRRRLGRLPVRDGRRRRQRGGGGRLRGELSWNSFRQTVLNGVTRGVG